MEKRLYKNLNIGGGLLYEFVNCCEGLIYAVKNKDTVAVKIYFEKLDFWGLEMFKQNKIVDFAKNDKTPGICSFELNKLLTSFL